MTEQSSRPPAPVVGLIGLGLMGAAIGGRLVSKGAVVRSDLSGRSAASRERAAAAGIADAAWDDVMASEIVLSIAPPSEAMAIARRVAGSAFAGRRPLFVECNAINPGTMREIAGLVSDAGLGVVDAGIIGPPPVGDSRWPVFYAAGERVPEFARLNDWGVNVADLGKPIGAGSALKMSYGGITKGIFAIGAAMMLSASKAGLADELVAEMSVSQPFLLKWLTDMAPGTPPRAYRWVGEMEEVGRFVEEYAFGAAMYDGVAEFYRRLAADIAGDQAATDVLRDYSRTVAARRTAAASEA